ncbi:hypothetical protein BH10ACT1_BH10ACT1_37660 [soil metagenome]
MTGSGWFPDPTGRFTQRWFDGADWTDQVLGANGQATGDPLVRTSNGSTEGPRSPGFGVALSFVGLLLPGLSLVALDWADGGADSSFSRLRDLSSDPPSGLSFVDSLVHVYVSFGGYLLLAVVALGLILVAAGAFGHGKGGLRMVVALVAGFAAVVHLAVVLRVFRGLTDPAPGAWVAVPGYLLAIVGLAFGPRRTKA